MSIRTYLQRPHSDVKTGSTLPVIIGMVDISTSDAGIALEIGDWIGSTNFVSTGRIEINIRTNLISSGESFLAVAMVRDSGNSSLFVKLESIPTSNQINLETHDTGASNVGTNIQVLFFAGALA